MKLLGMHSLNELLRGSLSVSLRQGEELKYVMYGNMLRNPEGENIYAHDFILAFHFNLNLRCFVEPAPDLQLS